MTIDFNCPKCGREMHAPDDAAGRRGKCKDCGGSVQVPKSRSEISRRQRTELILDDDEPEFVSARRSRQTEEKPVQVNVTQTQVNNNQSNALGVISIVVGAMAVCITWVPFLGMVGIPLALLGGLLGAIAILISLARGGAGVMHGVIGLGLSVFAIFVFFSITAAVVGGMKQVAEERNRAAEARLEEAKKHEQLKPIPKTEVEKKASPPTSSDTPKIVKSIPKLEPTPAASLVEEKKPKPTDGVSLRVIPAQKRFPGDPFYVRAVIAPSKYTKEQVIHFSQQILKRQQESAGVVDYFDSDGPLTWSGLMAINSDSTKAKWLCRVTVQDDGEVLFELGKDKNGKSRLDAVMPQ